MKYHIVTFGCQMNRSDSERISAKLKSDGYNYASKISEADLIVVNMCSVRQSAVDRVFGLGQKFNQLRTKNYKLRTVLTGCILKKDEMQFGKIFDEITEKKTWLRCEVKIQSQLIPISYGCNNFCAYCVVPHTRGRLLCRDHREILKKVEDAVKNRIKEIWLLGQNVNDYKSDKINFAKLLKMADDIPGEFQIRFMSPNPADFSDELIEAMVKCKKIAKFLNLPVQSGDNQILKKMNRRYTVEQYKNLVKKIRKAMPDINLSTDVIVGFPGETKKQFENTVKLFEEMKFSMAYVNKYSKRPGTAAFQLKDDVLIKEKKRREKILSGFTKKICQWAEN